MAGTGSELEKGKAVVPAKETGGSSSPTVAEAGKVTGEQAGGEVQGSESVQEGAARDSGAGSKEQVKELPAEYAALVTQQVQEALGKEEAKWEKQFAQLRSKKDKEVAAAKRELERLEAQRFEQAMALVEEDPQEAAQMLLQERQALQARRQFERQEEVVNEWIDGRLEELGLDPEDEEVSGLVSGLVQQYGSLADQRAGWLLNDGLQAIKRKQLEGQVAEEQKARKQFEQSVPQLIEQKVAEALTASGLASADAFAPKGTGEQRKDLEGMSESQLIQLGLEERRKRKRRRVRAVEQVADAGE